MLKTMKKRKVATTNSTITEAKDLGGFGQCFKFILVILSNSYCFFKALGDMLNKTEQKTRDVKRNT